MAKLTDEEVRSALEQLPEWRREGDEIVREFELPTFPEAIAFVVKIADLAQAADHHPDLDIRYTKVRVALTSHDHGRAHLERHGLGEEDRRPRVAGGLLSDGHGARGLAVFALIVALVVAVAVDPGPAPDESALAYEEAWDRLDFADAVGSLGR